MRNNDPRQIIVEDDDGQEHQLPTKFVVCDRCEGRGTHVNPSIDGHGISAEEWENEWDDEEREAYFNGRYDVRCEECRGARVVAVIDEGRCTPEHVALYQARQDEERSYRAECEAERRMGA